MRDHAPVLRAESPATTHHKPCDIITKHFCVPHAYSISFTLINHQHILCLVTFLYFKPDSSTTMTATNTKTTTRVCCLLFVQMKVTCEHFTDMSAKLSIANTLNKVSCSKTTYSDSKTTVLKVVIFHTTDRQGKNMFLRAWNCIFWWFPTTNQCSMMKILTGK